MLKFASAKHGKLEKRGLRIKRAFYGRKEDILKFVELSDPAIGGDIFAPRDGETIITPHRDLYLVDVTIPVKFSIDLSLSDGKGGLTISSGLRTKQLRPGFFNPIPSCLPDHDDPHLFIEVEIKKNSAENVQ